MKRHALSASSLLALWLPLCALCAQEKKPTPSAPLPKDRATGAEQISEEHLRTWLGKLASPEFEGRGTGQEGFRKAAEYMKAHFERLGLKGGAEDGGYLQAVPWTLTSATPTGKGLVIGKGDEVRWSLDVEHGLRGSASVETTIDDPVALVISGAEDGSDLADLDLDGHAVIVVLRRAADDAASGNPRDRAMRRMRGSMAVQNAVTKAKGRFVAIADDQAYERAGKFDPSSRPGQAAAGPAASRRGNMPTTCTIRSTDAAAILRALGDQRSLDAIPAPAVVTAPDVKVHLSIEVKTEQAPAWNVLGILPGSGDSGEFVGIGCHLDHLGIRNGVISPGADDDGSGSAGLMAISQAFVQNPIKPKRSILFMAFCGEEMGLIGSGFFAKNPTVPLEKMVAELQIDMIGRNEEGEQGEERAEDNLDCLHLIGSQKISDDLHRVCMRLNDERAHFALEWDQEGVFYRSDHWNFAREGVPIAFFFTGFHPQYHQPTDTIDRIDFHKLQRVATYVYDIGFELAQAEARPLIDADKWNSLRGKAREEPAAPVRK